MNKFANLSLRVSESEHKKIMLDIAQDIHDFCLKNNLRYSLSLGSMLGAVRHKGFIPWDDDLDIAMPRDDYMFFIKNYKSSKYKVISCYNNREYFLPFAKVFDISTAKIEPVLTKSQFLYGVDVDVYPFDYVQNKKQSLKIYNKKWKYINKLRISEQKHNISLLHPKTIIYHFFYDYHSNKFAKKIDKICQKYNKKKHEYCIGNTIFYKQNRVYNHDLFDSFIDVHFEEKVFKIVKKYDHFLTVTYGDYMTLPPKEKRISHHENNCFYIKNTNLNKGE